ncbi:MAG: phosphotransferase [Thermodesulfobacteria bacterium]|nr:phosphotransferase [Thermodesulfobacteriota bacterium]
MEDTRLKSVISKLKPKPLDIITLKGDGSNRKFYRLKFKNSSAILILPQEGFYGKREALSYYHIGKFFKKSGIPVPEIYEFFEDTGILLVEDLGDIHLFDIPDEQKLGFYKKIILILAEIQELVHEFPLKHTLETVVYDFNLMWEKEIIAFFKWQDLSVSKDFLDKIKEFFVKNFPSYKLKVIHRDFQSKNIMIKEDKVFVIDFQSARLGPGEYDLASLLLDPYVKIFNDFELVKKLALKYCEVVSKDKEEFLRNFYFFGIARLHQAISAYYRLSKLGKPWFKKYIPVAKKRLYFLLKKFFVELIKIYEVNNVL